MRLHRAAIIVTLTGLLSVAALLMAVACGDDDAGTPTDVITPTTSPTIKPTPDVELVPYFQELDTIFQKASDDSVTADAALTAALASAQDIAATKAAYTAFLTATEGTFQAAIVAMTGLQVPAVTADGHNAFVVAAGSSRNLAAELRVDIAAATTEAQLDTLLEKFATDKAPVLEEADAACSQLQETAMAHGIDVDLACGAG
jgi:hypothetical protein